MKFMLTWSRVPQLAFMTSNHDELLHELLGLLKRNFNIEYCCVAIEKHGEHDDDDGVHFHAAVKLSERKQLAIKNLAFYERIPNVQYKTTNMQWLTAKDYVKKDGEWIEFGDDKCEKKLRFKEKLNKIKEISFSNYIDSVATSLTDVKLFQTVAPIVKKPYKGIRELHWFYGETGTGKTSKAWEIIRDKEQNGFSYSSITFSGRTFINNYHGEDVVLIDDIRKSDIELNMLLKMLDRYEHVVNVKGGYCNWDAQVIIITCCFSPQDCFSYEKEDGSIKLYDNVVQLLRRLKEFGEVRCFSKDENGNFTNYEVEVELN